MFTIKKFFFGLSIALITYTSNLNATHASQEQSTETITAPCDCPQTSCNSKLLRCLWLICKTVIVIPASALTTYHFNEGCEFLISDYERAKALYAFTNCIATSFLVYATLKDSYEGLKNELPDFTLTVRELL